MQSFSDSFYRGFFEKRKGAGTRFPSHIFFGKGRVGHFGRSDG